MIPPLLQNIITFVHENELAIDTLELNPATVSLFALLLSKENTANHIYLAEHLPNT